VYVAECAFRSFNGGVPSTRTLRRARREHARATTLAGEGLPARRVMGERLKLSEEQVDALLEMIERRQVSFEVLASQSGSLNQSHFSCCEASPEQALVERAEQALRVAAIRGALAVLTERERAIVKHRLMGDESTALTLKELGDEFGVSRERVRQLEERLKRKLAENLRSALVVDQALPSSAAA
jgi:RNA polymerase sigma-32 factor